MNMFDKYMQITQCVVHLIEAKQALILGGAAPSEVFPLQSVLAHWADNLKIARTALAHKYSWSLTDDFAIHKVGETYVILFESGKREERKL